MNHSSDNLSRCPWCLGSELERDYHDKEWGVVERDERKLFEAISLEGAQAGLSWATILKKRQGYRKAFCDFDFERIASFTLDDVERLVVNPEIVRHRKKIESVISNAQATIEIIEAEGSFSSFLWSFVEGQPRLNRFTEASQLPSSSSESKAMSKELKSRGFSFVGPTTCYSFMQASGMVCDHLVSCFCYPTKSTKCNDRD